MAKNEQNDMFGNILKNTKGKSAESLMQRLSPADREKVQSILSSPEETNKFLSNPKIQELIRKLKNNG